MFIKAIDNPGFIRTISTSVRWVCLFFLNMHRTAELVRFFVVTV